MRQNLAVRMNQGMLLARRWLLPFYWVALAIGTHWPNLQLQSPDAGRTLLPIDKTAHVLGFGGLTVLLWWAMMSFVQLREPSDQIQSVESTSTKQRLIRTLRWQHNHGAALLAALIASSYALLDEWTQPWFSREFHWEDFGASMLGVAAGFLLIAGRPRAKAGRIAIAWLARLLGLVTFPLVLWLSLSPDASSFLLDWYAQQNLAPLVGDKLMHTRIALACTWILAMSAWLTLRLRGVAALLTCLLLLGSGGIVEWIQLQTGRSHYYDVLDIAAHQRGVILAIIVWVSIVGLRPIVWVCWRPVSHTLWHAMGMSGWDQQTKNQTQGERFVGAAALVSGITLLSRMTGLIRDAVLARFLGLSAVADAFFIGFLVPNLFRRLFGEGALSAAMIPEYTRLRERDPELARRFVSATLAVVGALLSAITLLGLAGLWWAYETWDASPRTMMAIRLAMIMLPYMPMVCLVGVLGGVLQVHQRFGPAAMAPIVLNVMMIAACFWAGMDFPAGQQTGMIAIVTGGSVLGGGLLQLMWLWISASRAVKPTWQWQGVGPSLRKMLIVMGPMVAGLAVYQLNALLDSLIAFGLSQSEQGQDHFILFGQAIAYPMALGDVAALQWAQRLYQFPLGVFGIAIATAIFPALAVAVSKDENQNEPLNENNPSERFTLVLRKGLMLTVFIGLPAAAGLIIVREPLVSVVFERGAFGAQDVSRVATILVGYASAVWAFTMTHVLTRGHYAKQDAKTPVKIAVAMVGLNLCLNLILIWPLGAAGLAWSTAISGVGHALLLAITLQRSTGPIVNAEVVGNWGRTAVASLVMVAVLWPMSRWVSDWPDAWALLVLVAVGIGVYGIASWLTNRDMLKVLKDRG